MPENPNHSRTGYVKGCRCSVCVEANNEYQRKYMREWRNRKKAQRLEMLQKSPTSAT